ncbi:MAG: hypothetical protein RRC34_11140 [Lentisphaeria bacterium]|nr:hypothetical protein [Lentisphaeria bacterium]
MGKKYQTPVSRAEKRLILGTGLAIALAVAGAVTWWLLNDTPPPAEKITDGKQAMEVLKTADFSKLSTDEKLAYAEKMRELHPRGGRPRGGGENREELSDEEKQRLRTNSREIFSAMHKKRMDDYFALPKEDQVAYLDKMIDEMAARGAEWQKARAEREKQRAEDMKDTPSASPVEDKPPREKPRERSPEERKERSMAHMKERIETTDPEERAKRIEFMKAMRERMEARKIEMPRWGRHGGGTPR